jgi:hypothetical protein
LMPGSNAGADWKASRLDAKRRAVCQVRPDPAARPHRNALGARNRAAAGGRVDQPLKTPLRASCIFFSPPPCSRTGWPRPGASGVVVNCQLLYVVV